VAEWYEHEYAADLDPYVTLLADHYGHTEEWYRFLEFAERAGQMAAMRYANAEAISYLSKAIAVLHDKPYLLPPDERYAALFRLLLIRAEVHAHSSDYEQQAHDLQELDTLAHLLEDEQRQALVLARRASYYQTTNDYDAAAQAAHAALSIAQQVNDYQLLGECHNLLAWNAGLRADYQQALDWGFKALNDCRLAADQTGEARSLDFLGFACAELGDYQQADDYYQQALALRRQVGDRWGEADSLSRIGNLADTLGRPREALDAHEEALNIRRSIGDRSGEASSLRNIGDAYQELGDLATAQMHLYEALIICHTLNNQYGEARLLMSLSAIATELGDFESAHHHALEGLELARKLGNRQVEVCGLDILGNASRGLDLVDEAYQQHSAAYELARDLRLPRWEAYARHHLGEWEWAAGNYAAAAEHWAAAVHLRSEIGELEFARASRTRQAHVLAQMGDLATARTLAEEVWAAWGVHPPPGEDEDELREGYFSLYETWHQLGEYEHASAALAWAYGAVQDRANLIHDPTLRESFLTRVVINRAILAAWNQVIARSR
jgi:tetratricopeptide (TPR) repeat protein